MKRTTTLITLAALAAFAVGLPAQDLYVSARMAMLLEQPNPTSGRVAMLRQGDALTELSADGRFYRVSTEAGQQGYVQNTFVGPDQPTGAVPEGGLRNISSVATRTRASAYQTSAAATRGLSEDNPRERQNLSFDDYNFRAITWIKRFTFTDDQIIAFAQQEGLGL